MHILEAGANARRFLSARMLFRAIDLQARRESGHHPVRMLALLPPTDLEDAAHEDRR